MKTCARCRKEYVSDRTPLGTLGYCMACRGQVDVGCATCGRQCKGSPDGYARCGLCRHNGYMKAWVWQDTTGGRLIRLQMAKVDPLKERPKP